MTATAVPPAGPQPAELLSGRPWIMRDKPFAHYLAGDVFTSAFYRELGHGGRRGERLTGYQGDTTPLPHRRSASSTVRCSHRIMLVRSAPGCR